MIENRYGCECVFLKAGCCLTYLDKHDEDHEHEFNHSGFHRLFPDRPDEPVYCSNCRFRPLIECYSHQVWWREREHFDRLAGRT